MQTYSNELFHQLIQDYYESEEKQQEIIDEYCKIEEWDVSQVIDMSGAFAAEQSRAEQNKSSRS